MLFWIEDEDVPSTAEDIDNVICAEILCPETNPRLHANVIAYNIHGPKHDTEVRCMEDGKCTKFFPKEYEDETVITSGYPVYRRREGRSYTIGCVEGVDSRMVVPYNPFLTLKYNCHINVEFCASLDYVKYLFDYVHKGHDCAMVKIATAHEGTDGQKTLMWDEIEAYVDTMIVTPPEAAWRLLKFPLYKRSHSICRLAVHIPFEQVIYFLRGQEELAEAINRDKDTTLTAWFKLNRETPAAREFLYREIPTHYRFDKKSRQWKERKRRSTVIGRIYSVPVSDTERYCLRLLLITVPGATSFEFLRNVDGVEHITFKEAAIVKNLLADDIAWKLAMEEAVVYQMPFALRELFVNICIHCAPTNARNIYDLNVSHLMEDYIHQGYSNNVAESLMLKEIADMLRRAGIVKSSFFGEDRSLNVVYFIGKSNEDFSLPVADFELINQIMQARENEEIDRQTATTRGGVMYGQQNVGQ